MIPGASSRSADLGELDLPGNMAVIFAAAFRSYGAPLSRDTRVSCWQALKVFSRFLAQEGGVADVEDITTGCSAVMCCGSMPSNLGDESPVRSGSGTIASSTSSG